MADHALLPPHEAWSRLEPHLGPLPAETVARRSALGRVLAEPLKATLDVPSSDVSAMDGYAVAGAVAAGERWPVVGLVSAGDPPGFHLPEGAAVRIMTGAPVPAAADRVIPVEGSDGGTEQVLFREVERPGAHIRRRGEVLRGNDPLLPAGALVTPGALALLATHGHARLPVHRLPRVSFLATGNEVVAPESAPRPGQVRDSHTDFLIGAGRSLGLAVEPLGIAPDQPEVLRERVEEGLRSDVLLLSGGVSMGEYDLVEEALAGLGCEILFDSVAVQPGKPLVAARHAGGLVFGLPGNPASAMVCFWLFVRPALRRLMGAADGYWHGALAATLAAPLPGAKSRDRFLPAEVAFGDGGIRVSPVPTIGSHDIAAYARGTALVRVPAEAAPARPGAACEILPLADWRVAQK